MNGDAEKIDIRQAASINGFCDLSNNHMTRPGADVIIDDLGGNAIVLANIILGDLTAVDFIF